MWYTIGKYTCSAIFQANFFFKIQNSYLVLVGLKLSKPAIVTRLNRLWFANYCYHPFLTCNETPAMKHSGGRQNLHSKSAPTIHNLLVVKTFNLPLSTRVRPVKPIFTGNQRYLCLKNQQGRKMCLYLLTQSANSLPVLYIISCIKTGGMSIF